MRRLRTRGVPQLLLITTLAMMLVVSIVGFASVIASSDGTQLPADKQAILDRKATLQADAVKRAPTKDLDLTKVAQRVPTRLPTHPPLTGISDIQPPPELKQEFLYYNRWQEKVNGEWIIVYAGVQRADESTTTKQGVVYVAKGEGKASNFTRQKYFTPTKAGGVRIIAVKDLQVTLIADEGITFVFDLASQTFK